MKRLIFIITFLFSSVALAGNFSGSGNSKSIIVMPEMAHITGDVQATAQYVRASQKLPNDHDQPYIDQTQWGDVLRYPQSSETIEGWEIIENFIDLDLQGSVFLNYSRFPFGVLQYDGKPTFVCYTFVGENIYLGSSENPLRMTDAILHLAMERNVTTERQSAQCKRTDSFLAQFPSAESISDILLELKSLVGVEI